MGKTKEKINLLLKALYWEQLIDEAIDGDAAVNHFRASLTPGQMRAARMLADHYQLEAAKL